MNTLASIWEIVIANSCRAALLMAAIFGLRAVFRGRLPAQCLHLLWLLVAVRLLLPVFPSSGWSVFNLFMPAASTETQAANRWRVTASQVSEDHAAAVTPIGIPATATQKPAQTVPSPIPLIWLGGASLQAALLIGSALVMLRKMRGARECVDPRVHAIAAECVQQFRLRGRLRILEVNAAVGPAVVGLFRPRILWPAGFAANLSDDQLRFVLLHECAHLRRRDLPAFWIMTVARVVHWFNPLVWMAARAARTDAELACDETVLRTTGAEKSEPYGRTLLKLAELISWRAPLAPTASVIAGRRSLRRRVAHVAAFSSGWRRKTWITALVVPLAGICLVADEVPPAQPTAPSPSDEGSEPLVPATGRPIVEVESRFIEFTETAARTLALRNASPKSDAQHGTALLGARRSDGAAFHILSATQSQELLRTLNGAKGVDLLTAPRVTTRSGQRAVVEIAREFRYPKEFAAAEGRPGHWIPQTFETRNTGVTLGVEPTVKDEGTVGMKVSPQVVEFLGFRDLDSGKNYPAKSATATSLEKRLTTPMLQGQKLPNQLGSRVTPVFSTRKAEAEVTLQPGQSVVVVGLDESENAQGFPARAKSHRLAVLVSAKVIKESDRTADAPAEKQDESPTAAPNSLPAGIAIADRPGFVKSPHAPDSAAIDVRGLPSGTAVRCPASGKNFRVP